MNMRRSTWMVSLCMALIASTASGETPAFLEKQVTGGALREINHVPVLELSGTPQKIGQQEAELAADRAKSLLGFGPALVKRRGASAFWNLHVIASKSLVENADPRFRDEMASFQKTSGLSSDELIASQTLYDTMSVFGCSSLIVPANKSATGGPLLGRNFDYASLGLLHENDLLKIVRPEGKYAFASVSFPGCFGVVSGMNEHGLALVLHEVRQSADGSSRYNSEGVPTLIALRQVLEECKTVDEAKELLTKLPRTTMYNLAVCDPQGGAIFEITTKQVVMRREEGINACTNHFRAEGLSLTKSCDRFATLMKEEPAKYTIDRVFRKLGEVAQNESTFQTMIFEPKGLVLHLAIETRPSTDGLLRKIDLKPLFEKP